MAVDMRFYKYDIASGQILEGGYYQPEINPETQALVSLEDDDTPHPDHRTKRVQDGAIREATLEEIATYDTAKAAADLAAAVGQNPLIAAVGLTLETRRVGRELTPEEQQGLLTEVAARFRVLRGQG